MPASCSRLTIAHGCCDLHHLSRSVDGVLHAQEDAAADGASLHNDRQTGLSQHHVSSSAEQHQWRLPRQNSHVWHASGQGRSLTPSPSHTNGKALLAQGLNNQVSCAQGTPAGHPVALLSFRAPLLMVRARHLSFHQPVLHYCHY